MRTVSFQLMLVTGLLAWCLQRRGVSSRFVHAIQALGLFLCVLSLPRVLWGWQVQQHLPLSYLKLELGLGATWLFGGIAIIGCLLLWDIAVAGIARPVDLSRRKMFRSLPLVAGAVGPVGASRGQVEPTARRVKVAMPGLPAALDGLRILQISDLHLGPCLGLDWLDRALERSRDLRPDLVVVTGDLSDDVELTLPALLRIAHVEAPLGHFAIPGNHEHYVGIERFSREVRAAGLTLLTGRAQTLLRGDSTLTLLGIDFVTGVQTRDGEARAYEAEVQQVLAHASPGFQVLLAHHPNAFDAAAAAGINLTLSGHIHGGQIAVMGWSPISLLMRYTRGVYSSGDARLFVTTGLGHWMPFRIGCPTELPIIELSRGHG